MNTLNSTHRDVAAAPQDRRSARRPGHGAGGAFRTVVAGVAALLCAAPAAAAVEVVGVDGALAANVLAYLSLDEEACDAPRWRIEQQYRAAPGRIREALQAFGHYEPRIVPELTFPEDCWHVVFTIDAGEPILIRGFDVQLTGEAASDESFAAVSSQSALRSGAILSHAAYERLKRGWSDLARERGYPDARFIANRIDVYPEQHVADIVLQFDSGARYAFGRTEFRQDVLTDRLAQSYVPFKAGEPYDGRRLTELYVALADSGYFRNIDVRPLEADPATRTIPVEIALTAGARRQISYGVGFSTDTGPRLRFGRNNRLFNDRGHQFGVNAQLSPVVSEVTANYRLPLGRRSEWINLDAGLERDDTDTAESNRLELGASRVLDRPSDWTRSVSLTLRIEDFTVADQVGRSRLLMPGVDWTRILTDNLLRPRHGSKMSLQVRGGHDDLGSDTTFVQTVAQGKWIWSLPRRGARLIVRGQVGATAKQSFEELPASVRFFAGGDKSVRGYEFESLGPVDENGEVIGGSRLATGSFEFEKPLHERWSLALFVDSGNAFEGSRLDAKTGAGLGGRWQSPLGPIRIDVAHPFNDPTDSWRLHISLGPDL